LRAASIDSQPAEDRMVKCLRNAHPPTRIRMQQTFEESADVENHRLVGIPLGQSDQEIWPVEGNVLQLSTNNIDIITLNDATSVDQFEDHAAEHPRLHCIEIDKSIRIPARARAGCYLHTFTSMWEAAGQKTLPRTEKLSELFTQAGGSAMALAQQLTHQRTRLHRVHRPIEFRRQVRRMLAGNKNHL